MSDAGRMRPWSEVSAQRCREIAGVATDLDDTLTAHGRLPSCALDALYALRAAGVPCVIATGRPVGWAEVLASVLPVRAVVAENGGAWALREGNGVRVAFIDDPTTRSEGISRARAMVERVRERFPEMPAVIDWTVRATDITLDVGERVKMPDSTVREALAMVRAAGLHGVASTVHLHVSAAAPDKVRGLRAALEDLGLDAAGLTSEWAYVGDSPNDAAAFGAIALSVGVRAVSRFRDVIPVMPAYVTEGGAGEGFAEVVATLLSARSAA